MSNNQVEAKKNGKVTAFGFVLMACYMVAVQGFVVQTQRQQSRQQIITATTTTTTLFGRKKKGLGSIVAEGLDSSSSTSKKKTTLKQRSTRKKKTSSTTKSNKKKEESSGISPALAEWMSSQEDEKSGTESFDVEDEEDDDDEGEDDNDDAVVAFASFTEEETKASTAKGNTSRRVKQSARKEMEEKRSALIETRVDALQEALEESGNLSGILSAVKGLLELPSDNLRLLIAGKRRFDYRLAWVGGDDAICHVGTGLHKVPLARLQEVFMSCLGRNRMEVLEVIRILGPFPNVKNILQGTTKIVKNNSNDDVTGLNIVMDSMVDGTGKEILAGKDDNIRKVDLQVYFADERAIVAVVPPESGEFREDPLENNGANVLVFVKEDELEDKLDALRVL